MEDITDCLLGVGEVWEHTISFEEVSDFDEEECLGMNWNAFLWADIEKVSNLLRSIITIDQLLQLLLALVRV